MTDHSASEKVPPVCGFCKGGPVYDAATWVDGKPRPLAPCPRCGQTATAAEPPYDWALAEPESGGVEGPSVKPDGIDNGATGQEVGLAGSGSASAPANPLLDQAVDLAESAWPGSTRVLRKPDEQQLRDELAAADHHEMNMRWK